MQRLIKGPALSAILAPGEVLSRDGNPFQVEISRDRGQEIVKARYIGSNYYRVLSWKMPDKKHEAHLVPTENYSRVSPKGMFIDPPNTRAIELQRLEAAKAVMAIPDHAKAVKKDALAVSSDKSI